jgi:diaminohydroxyphosphoribosylaminopyrimidine deaminase/5-amino-6-(5-phosphoribosylamino)uracil reductase
MANHDHDEAFMKQALELARQGVGLASPNPCVGAIIVDAKNRVVGRGFHTYDGRKHAEVLAIEEAGEHARGSTLYLNLEPCAHTGRTGPCADAVIAASLRRVVAAMRDPNPLVSGKGFEKLRAAGIEVVEGVLEGEAQRLNEAFSHFIKTRMPFGILKTGMTLDGKIAAASGISRTPNALGSGRASIYITGEESLRKVHELRHESDAIMVGVGTIIADDPLLTDRSGKPRRRNLLRVILDSRLRLPVESRVVKTCENDVIVFCSFGEEKKRKELESRGVIVEQVQLAGLQVVGGTDAVPHDGRPDLTQVFRRLGEMDVTSGANIINKVWLFYAPKLLGGEGAVPFLYAGHSQMAEATRVKNITLHRFGEDFAVEGYLREE